MGCLGFVAGFFLAVFVYAQTGNDTLAFILFFIPGILGIFLQPSGRRKNDRVMGKPTYTTPTNTGTDYYSPTDYSEDSRRHEHPEHRPRVGRARTEWREQPVSMSPREIDKQAARLSALMAGKLHRGEIPGDPREYLRSYVEGERYAQTFSKQEEANMQAIAEAAIRMWEEDLDRWEREQRK
jgi:hypothetical protein